MPWFMAVAWSAQPGMVWLLPFCPLVLKVSGNPQSSLRRINHCMTWTYIPPHLAAVHAPTLLQLPSNRCFGQDETESQQTLFTEHCPGSSHSSPTEQCSLRLAVHPPPLAPALVSLTLELKPFITMQTRPL